MPAVWLRACLTVYRRCAVRAQLIATVRVSPSPDLALYGVALNPINATKCVVNGNRTLKLLSIEDDR